MNTKSGLRIGRYRLTPLGLGVAVFLLVLLVALIAMLIVKGLGGRRDRTLTPGDGNTVVAVNTPEPTLPEESDVSVEPTATPVPTPTPVPALRSARIRSLGEVIADNNILKSAYQQQQEEDGTESSTFSFRSMFDMIGRVIADADYTVAEVDGTMGGKGVNGYRGKNGEYNTPPHIMLALLENGVDMLSLAHDHALDELYDGLDRTVKNCQQANMDYVGAATSQEEHDTPKIVDINGIQVGFLGYTDSFNGKEKNAAKEALQFGVNYTKEADCAADAKKARDAGAEVLIAYVSWGKQYAEKADKSQAEIARALVKAGVDVIIGYNPRVVQGQPTFWLEVEQEDGTKLRTLCVTSLGTFLSDSRDKNQDCGIIFEFTISETEPGKFEIINPKYIPTYVWRTEKADGLYDYKVLACGEWLTSAPEGMSEADYARMNAVWADMQALLGTTELSVSAN